MKQDFDELLQKQMDRRDFLKHVAIGFVALTGISALVSTLNSFSSSKKRQTTGYGASVYGGKSTTQKQRS